MISKAGRKLTLRVHLMVFGLICFVPAILIALYLAVDTTEREQQRVQDQSAVLLSNHLSAVEETIGSSFGILHTLSQTAALRNGRFNNFQPLAEAVATYNDAAIVVRSLEGQHLMNTLIPFGSRPLPKTQDPILLAADAKAIATKKPVVSDVYVGATSNQPFVSVVFPVIYDGQLTYLLTMAFTSDRISKALKLGQLAADGWLAAVLGSDGRLIARTRTPEQFVGRLASADLRQAAQADAGVMSSTTLDGIEVLTSFRKSSLGWTIVSSAPKAILQAPVYRLIAIISVLAVAVLAITATAASLYGNKLARDLKGLSENALALGDDKPLQAYPNLIKEVSDAQNVLFRSRDKIHELLAELNHRVKNTLAIVGVIASRSSPDPQVRTVIAKRVGALARAHEALSDNLWKGADLHELISKISQGVNADLECRGAAVTLTPRATVAMAQIVQELVSNAQTHGSLAQPDGCVRVTWQIDQSHLAMDWNEAGPPVIDTSTSQGFGSQIIDLCVRGTLGGTYSVQPDPQGWNARLQIPLRTHLGQNIITAPA